MPLLLAPTFGACIATARLAVLNAEIQVEKLPIDDGEVYGSASVVVAAVIR